MSLKKTEFLKIVKENKYLKEAYDEYSLVCGNNEDEYITYPEIFNVLNFHIYEILEIDYEFNVQRNNKIFCESREEYSKIFQELHIANYILDTYQTTFIKKKTTGGEVVKKFPSMIYCLSVNPPPDTDPNDLYKVVKQIVKLSGCEYYYGVFECGRQHGKFHFHIMLKANEKSYLQNVKKKLKEKNWNLKKIDFYKDSQHLLKTLRYLHCESKDNKGIIGEANFNYFINLCNSTAHRKCKTTEYAGKIWNL